MKKEIFKSIVAFGVLFFVNQISAQEDVLKLNENGSVEINGPTKVTGTLNVTGNIQQNGVDLMPKGSIIMWYGDVSNLPKGWIVCDGSNGTPDMRGKFPVGVSNTKVTDNMGENNFSMGSNKSTFSTKLKVENLPAHSHPASMDPGGRHKHKIGRRGANVSGSTAPMYGGSDEGKFDSDNVIEAGSEHTHEVKIGETGNGTEFNVIPPYMALYFLYKKE